MSEHKHSTLPNRSIMLSDNDEKRLSVCGSDCFQSIIDGLIENKFELNDEPFTKNKRFLKLLLEHSKQYAQKVPFAYLDEIKDFVVWCFKENNGKLLTKEELDW